DLPALPQQELSAADPAPRSNRARDVIDALLVHADPTLLDAAARLALGLGETRSGDEIDEREAVRVALDHDRRNLTCEDVEHLRMDLGLFIAKQDRGSRLDALQDVGAVHACRHIGGERALRG